MELIIISCIAISIALFTIKEIVVLYFTRTKRSGLLLESQAASFYPNGLPTSLRLLDTWLILIISLTLLLYIIALYEGLTQATEAYELAFIDIGAAILIYILMPSRKIQFLLDDKGLKNQQMSTGWEFIDYASIELEPSVRRMLLVQFSCKDRIVPAYLYERDIYVLKRLLAEHSIRLKEY